jgi:catechol 2,3-dioxygenase-like lactoylglutathione lyase family enzyme
MHAGLGKYKVVAFVTIMDVGRAKEFYRDTLGLTLISEEPPYALVFDANGIMLRLRIRAQESRGSKIQTGIS